MVAKINIGSSLFGALSYNQEKVDEGLGKVLATNRVHEPADGKFSVAGCAADFSTWMPSHYRTEKPVIHISLNPHPDDRLTNEQLADIGQEYMDRLGYGNQPYVIFKHEDIGREHIHIVSLRVDSEGKKIGDSFEHRRSKEITEELEKKYNLHPAEGQKQGEQWQLSPIDPTCGNLKKQIASVIKPLSSMYHFQSMGEYKALLSLYNIGVEETKGERSGKTYRGLLYCALDKEGNKTGTPLKSSLFGKMVGYDNLEKQMEKSAVKIKKQGFRDQTKDMIANVLKNSRNESEFRAKLQGGNMDVYFRRNEEGRIYGATFIDHNNRCVLNGSRMGKEFSANVFNDLFNGKSYEVEKNPDPKKAFEPFLGKEDNDTSIGSLLGLLTPDPDGHADDNRPVRKRKKKNRRRYGRQM